MRVAFEKRLAQLEKRVAAKAEETKVCNCRSITHFHKRSLSRRDLERNTPNLSGARLSRSGNSLF